jgi:hypothetical protein
MIYSVFEGYDVEASLDGNIKLTRKWDLQERGCELFYKHNKIQKLNISKVPLADFYMHNN